MKLKIQFFLGFLIMQAGMLIAQTKSTNKIQLGEIDSTNIFKSADYYNWCPSVIKGDDGKCYMFYSRWTHGRRKLDDDSLNYIFDGFMGWMKYSEIACAVSDKLLGPIRLLRLCSLMQVSPVSGTDLPNITPTSENLMVIIIYII
ncbi:hypothetical protein CPT03_04815 [Pedobacter ginsengisoli]|uniref:Glycosyl hydrolase family 32 N-terminal domain-containing protein n=1 Tax=Pedobacter ginsengisoli TaxID=363852 RepID=A0A2D1U2L2_9SPHI|nr:hypothetical protein [Pedobacter ginsengisoli]ATP55835.1 hypothetical protein CPT03_04815 [Pedobacter ginsengisoli]